MSTKTWWPRLVSLAVWAGACGCGTTQIQVYNQTSDAVVVTVGGKTVNVALDWPQALLEGSFKDGASVTARSGEVVVDEAVLPEGSKGNVVIYNVAGAGDLFVVDYFNSYAEEGKEAPSTQRPFDIVIELKGQKLTVAPKGTVVANGEPLPRSVVSGTHVMRIEHVPPSLATNGVEAYLLQTFRTDLQMRGALYFH